MGPVQTQFTSEIKSPLLCRRLKSSVKSSSNPWPIKLCMPWSIIGHRRNKRRGPGIRGRPWLAGSFLVLGSNGELPKKRWLLLPGRWKGPRYLRPPPLARAIIWAFAHTVSGISERNIASAVGPMVKNPKHMHTATSQRRTSQSFFLRMRSPRPP